MKYRMAVIGTGKMGEAVVAGLVGRAGWQPGDIVCTARRAERCDALTQDLGVATTMDNAAAASAADIVLLALKPQVLLDELPSLAAAVQSAHLVVSVAAGITTGAIEQVIGQVPVVRAMPNTPLFVGQGMTAIAGGQHAESSHLAAATEIFAPMGDAAVVNEDLIDAVTAVSGSGPAYVFRMVEAWIAAAVEAGLDQATARRFVIQTLTGSAAMLREPDADPARLRADVTSPGGTTEAGLAALDAAGFSDALSRAIAAAHLRARELGAT